MKTPVLSIGTTSPVLVQTGNDTWTTTVLVADSVVAVSDAVYTLVPINPAAAIVTGTAIACPPRRAPTCALPAGQVTRVKVRFEDHFSAPLTVADLAVSERPAPGAVDGGGTGAPAVVQLAIQRDIGPSFDLVVPLVVAATLAALTLALTVGLVGRIRPGSGAVEVSLSAVRSSLAGQDLKLAPLTVNAIWGRPIVVSTDPVPIVVQPGANAVAETVIRQPLVVQPPGTGTDVPIRFLSEPQRFLAEPVYASASWSFKDSWATNISALGGAVVSVLSAAGATSTVFPGVQMDRFAILMALWAAVVLAAPLVLAVALPRSDDASAVKANVGSLLAAALVTLLGIGGELGTAGSLVWLSSATAGERVALLALPASAAAIVVCYACRTTVELIAHNRFSTQHSSGLSAGRDSSLTL